MVIRSTPVQGVGLALDRPKLCQTDANGWPLDAPRPSLNSHQSSQGVSVFGWMGAHQSLDVFCQVKNDFWLSWHILTTSAGLCRKSPQPDWIDRLASGWNRDYIPGIEFTWVPTRDEGSPLTCFVGLLSKESSRAK